MRQSLGKVRDITTGCLSASLPYLIALSLLQSAQPGVGLLWLRHLSSYRDARDPLTTFLIKCHRETAMCPPQITLMGGSIPGQRNTPFQAPPITLHHFFVR